MIRDAVPLAFSCYKSSLLSPSLKLISKEVQNEQMFCVWKICIEIYN